MGPGQILDSGPAGSVSLQIDLTAIPSATETQPALPGDVLYFQAWHRDANLGPTSNFTDLGAVTLD